MTTHLYHCCGVEPVSGPGGNNWLITCGHAECPAWTSYWAREETERNWNKHRAADDAHAPDDGGHEEPGSGYQGSDTIESRVAAMRLK